MVGPKKEAESKKVEKKVKRPCPNVDTNHAYETSDTDVKISLNINLKCYSHFEFIFPFSSLLEAKAVHSSVLYK